MIDYFTQNNKKYVLFQFDGMDSPQVFRLFDVENACPKCLRPIDNDVCPDCTEINFLFKQLITLGYYVKYDDYQEKFGQHRWSELCSWVLNLKPGKLQDEGLKQQRGDYLARLSYDFIIKYHHELWFSDIVVPVPQDKGFNQIDYWGPKLSQLFRIQYNRSLIKKDGSTFTWCGGNVSLREMDILLLDDIYTSGRESQAMCQILKEHGARIIYVYKLLRTVPIEYWGDEDLG